MTGEFTIDYTPPAWYTQNAPGDSSGGAGTHLAPPPPPTGAPVSVPGLPAGSGFEPDWTPAPPAAAHGAAAEPPVPDAGGAPDPFGGGDVESGATMRFSSAALKREIAEREAAAQAHADGAAETGAEAEAGAGAGAGAGGRDTGHHDCHQAPPAAVAAPNNAASTSGR